MNLRRGFRRIVFVLSIVVSISCVLLAMAIVSDKYYYKYCKDLDQLLIVIKDWFPFKKSET
jgi:hypothetical protein